jgi:hypothetical protein
LDSVDPFLDLCTGEQILWLNACPFEWILRRLILFVRYSEGKSLTTEDEKTYWGKICYADEDGADGGENVPKGGLAPPLDSNEDDQGNGERRLLVKGSVIYGYGLEPLPVGNFIMAETSELELDDDDGDDDDDDDDEAEEELGDFSDWSNAFQ